MTILKKVLLHICCGPCTIYPLKQLRNEHMHVHGFFYNPNIHPYTEHTRRLKTLEQYAKVSLLPLTINNSYELEDFLKGALSYGKNRCIFCYRTRLEKAFQEAVEIDADAVTTTLLYSKYQRHEDIRTICEEFSKQYGVDFIYRDFRIGWREGIEESINLNMYRQNYCGCILSEKERFKKN